MLRIFFFCSPVRARLRGQSKAHRQAGYLTRSPLDKSTWPSRAARRPLSSHGSCGSLTARGADQVYPEHTGNMWTGRAVTGASDLQEGSVGIEHPLFPVCPLCSGLPGQNTVTFSPAGLEKAGRAVGLETSRHGSPPAKNRRDNGQSRLISHLSQTKQNPPGWWLRSLGPGYKTRRGRPTHARDMIEQKGGNNGRDLSREGHVNLVPWCSCGR